VRILFAAERTRPRPGGAERFARELLAFLSRRHQVETIWLDGPRTSAERYWQAKTRSRAAARAAVRASLARRPADVVLTQLHAAPGVTDAAAETGAACVQLLPSYEPLCKYAFLGGSTCRPAGGCGACDAARARSPAERRALVRSRAAHERALAQAAALIAPSEFVADAYRRWCGRSPLVAHPIASVPSRVPPRPDGPAVLAAARWKEHKGLELLVPIAEVSGRELVVAGPGLPRRVSSRLRSLGHVRLVSYRPIDRLLDGAGAVLVPSQWPEPFGRIAFEGLAAGVPTLASATGGLPELVPEAQLVHAFREPQAWAEALGALAGTRRWQRARSDGLAAAGRLLADRPLERIEAALEAATRRRSP
jgi:glycosyltransferase involved in cell wall biosynthesis